MRNDKIVGKTLDMNFMSSNSMTIAGQGTTCPDVDHTGGDWGKEALQATTTSIGYEAYCQLNPFNEGDLNKIVTYNGYKKK